MRKIILIITLIVYMSLVLAYTAPGPHNVNRVLDVGYVPPGPHNVNLVLADAVGPCDCPGLNKGWEIDHADACVIVDDCDLGNGELTFIGVGMTTCDAKITTASVGDPGTGGYLFIKDDDCLIDTS